ncbi:MAG: EamA family transporter, partial [Planctomycetota bacterium]
MWYLLLAIALWSSLAAVAGNSLDTVAWPLLLAVSLGTGGATLWGIDLARGKGPRHAFGGGGRAWALGLWGIFGYHAFLFSALAVSPGQRVPVNLLNYLWPLSLVLFAGLLEGGWRLRALLGAAIGLAGAGLAIASQGLGDLTWSDAPGYGLALGAAITWGAFSALLPRTPGAEGRMAGWCLASGAIAGAIALVHGTGDGLTTAQWLGALYLGVGPLGIAFTAWEAGLKRMSGQVAGAVAYLAPPTSTLLLAFSTGEG